MIEKKEVEKIAKLARINFRPKDIEKFEKELSVILDYFKLLDEVDVSDIPPFFNFSSEQTGAGALSREEKGPMPSPCPARKDIALETESRDLIDSAPARQDNYFKVKEVF